MILQTLSPESGIIRLPPIARTEKYNILCRKLKKSVNVVKKYCKKKNFVVLYMCMIFL